MRFFLDECLNVKVDAPLKAWLTKDEFLRSGLPTIPYGMNDIELIQELAKLEVDAVFTSDLKQMNSPDRIRERQAYRAQNIHWVGVPQSFVKGRARPYVQAANLLSAVHFVRSELAAAEKPLAIELKTGFRKVDDPVSKLFDI
ncbi:hypothetical protein QQO25_12425 [Corynebacterium lehmanniae]|nr:hypothetical protein [Corynebacterium lehmanniae]